jgi:hypothetical protein
MPIDLSEAAINGLTKLIKTHQTGQQLVLRARIILAAGQGQSNTQIARTLGKVERREYEYIGHDPLSFMVNFEVGSGQIGTVSVRPTRTEEDYVQHITDGQGRANGQKVHFIVDNLNIHQSEGLVR